jgi:hypothetical protein
VYSWSLRHVVAISSHCQARHQPDDVAATAIDPSPRLCLYLLPSVHSLCPCRLAGADHIRAVRLMTISTSRIEQRSSAAALLSLAGGFIVSPPLSKCCTGLRRFRSGFRFPAGRGPGHDWRVVQNPCHFASPGLARVGPDTRMARRSRKKRHSGESG